MIISLEWMNGISETCCGLRAKPEKKIHMLLDFTQFPRAIADPWYTGNFDVTYEDVKEGCEALLKYLRKEHLI